MITALIAVASGVLAALGGASPTGSTAVDFVLVAGLVALVTWVAAAGPLVVAGGAALVAGALSGSPWLAGVGVAAFGAAMWRRNSQQFEQITTRITTAVVALVAMNIAARGSLDWFLGAETIVAIVVALVMTVAGLRRRDVRTRRIVAGIAIAYAAVAVVGTAATAWSGVRAVDELRAAQEAVDGALDLVMSGDRAAAQSALDTAIDRLSSFESAMESPLTAGAAIVPVVAQHRDAALEVSRSAGAAMSVIASELDAFDVDAIVARPGTIDLEAVDALERPMLEFQQVLDEVTADVHQARSAWLIDRVSRRLDDLELTVDKQSNRANIALDVIRAMPGLLGGNGPRTYFLGFTTPAEARGMGGFMGLFAEITADGGHIEMTRFDRIERLAWDLEASDATSVIERPAEWLNRYSRFGFARPWSQGLPAGTWGNITMSPHAASTGEVIAQLYPQSGGRQIDGVFAVDITTVARLLNLTGPVVTSGGVTLDADNANEFLLNSQYHGTERPARRDVLEEVAETVVDELLGGSLPSPGDALDALGPMVEQGRLIGWAADVGEQSLFEALGLGSAWPAAVEGDAVAVAFNNSAASKLDYFAHARAHYDVLIDASTSHATGRVLVELENRPPPTPQPDYVMKNMADLPRGYTRTWVSVYTRVPATAMTVDGREVRWDFEEEAGFFVASTFVTAAPGDMPAIEVTLDGPVELTDDGYRLALWSPPTANVTPVTASVEVRQPDGSATQATAESLGGTAHLLVPIPTPE